MNSSCSPGCLCDCCVGTEQRTPRSVANPQGRNRLRYRVGQYGDFMRSMIADLGPIFVLLKFVSAPVSAFLLWREHHPWTALMALLWPVLGPLVAGWLLAAPYALLVLTRVGEQAQIGADLRVPHLFCDPKRAERVELESRDDAAGYAAREQVWLGRLESMISAPHANVLVACGASHVGTFSDVLQARSLLSRVLVEDWTTL